MKANTNFLHLLSLALLLTVNLIVAKAQGPYPSVATPHAVCLNSTEPYGVVLTTGSTYAWSISDPTAGTISAGATSNLITVNWEKTGNYTLQVTETNQYNCVGSPVSIAITVNPIAVIANKAATICSGETFTVTPADGSGTDVVPTGTTYSWSAPVVAGITGAASGSAATNISGTLTNTTNAPIDVVYTVTPKSGTCDGTPFTVTVRVYPPVITSPIYHN